MELRLTPPDQTEEDAIRDFVAWLSQIEITNDPTSFTDIKEFLETLRNAAPLIESPPSSPPDFMGGSPLNSLHINVADAPEYLRAAFRLWVTELRPRWRGYLRYTVKDGDGLATIAAKYNVSESTLANLNQVTDANLQVGMVLKIPKLFCDGTPPDEGCILLAELDVPLVDGKADSMNNDNLHEERRPYVVHLQMLQEWLLSGAFLAWQGLGGLPFPNPATADLTRIIALSWDHAEVSQLDVIVDGSPQKAVVVAFGKQMLGDAGRVLVEPGSLDEDLFQIFVEQPEVVGGVDLWNLRRLRADRIVPVQSQVDASGRIIQAVSVPGPDAMGAAFIFDTATFDFLQWKKMLIVMKGDLILDETGNRSIAASYRRAQLPTGDPSMAGPLEPQGGQFESWSWIGQLINVNTATKPELRKLPGITAALADKIIQRRTTVGLFTSKEELAPVITAQVLRPILPFITVGP